MDAVLATIQKSLWAGEPPARLRSFYPSVAAEPCYGLYSPGLDRFLIVDRYDLWTLFHAARLLSSKLPLVCYAFPPAGLSISNCLKWTLVEKTTQLSSNQTPVLKALESPQDLVELGVAPDFSEVAASLVRDQEFALFVLRATRAMRVTDAMLNRSAQDFFTRLSPDFKAAAPFRETIDDTSWPLGFVGAVERILYHSLSIEEALERLEKQLPRRQRKDTVTEYSETFFGLLGWSPKA